MWMIIGVIVMVISLLLLALGVRAIYVSFFKKKDERSMWIVQSSMAQSFIVVIILQLIVYVIKNADQVWWDNFKQGIYIDPFALSIMILGLLLVVNTKKHGGSV